jgi:hypothetical protein
MEYLCARIVKWKRKKTTHKNTRIDEFSLQLFDAIYENKFELSKILIDDGKVDVNIKKDCGDTPLIATCQQTTLQNEDAMKTRQSEYSCVLSFFFSISQFLHRDTPL